MAMTEINMTGTAQNWRPNRSLVKLFGKIRNKAAKFKTFQQNTVTGVMTGCFICSALKNETVREEVGCKRACIPLMSEKDRQSRWALNAIDCSGFIGA